MCGAQRLGRHVLYGQVREQVQAGGQKPVGEAVFSRRCVFANSSPDARPAPRISVDRDNPGRLIAAKLRVPVYQ